MRQPELVHVSIRLYEDDVEELRKRAKAARDRWQVVLRRILHDALRQHREVR